MNDELSCQINDVSSVPSYNLTVEKFNNFNNITVSDNESRITTKLLQRTNYNQSVVNKAVADNGIVMIT